MQYKVGMKLKYFPDSKLEQFQLLTVAELRKKGCAKLSNGWLADEDGIVEGNSRIPGGRVESITLGNE